MQLFADRLEDRQVDQFAKTLRQIGWLRLLRLGLHEAAAPDFAGHKPSADQFVIGAAHRLNRQRQLVGKVAMGRKALTVG
ncbi:hypothetical protein D3C87_1936760 [compost metagenome]